LNLDDLDEMDFSAEEVAALALETEDLLVCEGGDIGRTAIWRGERNDCLYQNHLHRLRRIRDDVHPLFVMYWLWAGMTQLNVYEGAGNKTTIPNLSRSRLGEFEIPLPPLVEQKKIAAVLLKLQRAIELQDKIIQALRDLKKSTMQHVFTHGLRGEKTKMTEIGEIPESWNVVLFAQILEGSLYGLSVRGQKKGTYPILRMNCQVDGRVELTNLQYVDLNAATFSKYRLEDGDLLFNRTNSHDLVGRTAIFHVDRKVVFASYLIRLRLDTAVVSPDFINYYLNMSKVQNRVRALASKGVSQSNISASKLNNFKVLLPDRIGEQEDVVGALASLDRRLQANEYKKSNLQSLFKTLLNKLMIGNIRVGDLDIDVKDVGIQ